MTRFLQAFESFDRKLGCTMEAGGGSSGRGGDRSRQASNRNIVSFRERERGERDKSPKPVPKAGGWKAPPGGASAGKEEEGGKSGTADKVGKVICFVFLFLVLKAIKINTFDWSIRSCLRLVVRLMITLCYMMITSCL